MVTSYFQPAVDAASDVGGAISQGAQSFFNQPASSMRQLQQSIPQTGGGPAFRSLMGGLASGKRAAAADELNQFMAQNPEAPMDDLLAKTVEIGNRHGVPELINRAQRHLQTRQGQQQLELGQQQLQQGEQQLATGQQEQQMNELELQQAQNQLDEQQVLQDEQDTAQEYFQSAKYQNMINSDEDPQTIANQSFQDLTESGIRPRAAAKLIQDTLRVSVGGEVQDRERQVADTVQQYFQSERFQQRLRVIEQGRTDEATYQSAIQGTVNDLLQLGVPPGDARQAVEDAVRFDQNEKQEDPTWEIQDTPDGLVYIREAPGTEGEPNVVPIMHPETGEQIQSLDTLESLGGGGEGGQGVAGLMGEGDGEDGTDGQATEEGGESFLASVINSFSMFNPFNRSPLSAIPGVSELTGVEAGEETQLNEEMQQNIQTLRQGIESGQLEPMEVHRRILNDDTLNERRKTQILQALGLTQGRNQEPGEPGPSINETMKSMFPGPDRAETDISLPRGARQ